MEQQIQQMKAILCRLPKAVLVELLIAQTTAAEELPKAPLIQHVPRPYKPRAEVTRRKWTPEQDEALIYAVKQGRKSYREIGQLLGRTHKATCQRTVILRNRGLL
jgi:hypothetical protein